MEELKKLIIDHLDVGLSMERYSNKNGIPVPKERLEGFRDGLRITLKFIDSIEKGEDYWKL